MNKIYEYQFEYYDYINDEGYYLFEVMNEDCENHLNEEVEIIENKEKESVNNDKLKLIEEVIENGYKYYDMNNVYELTVILSRIKYIINDEGGDEK